MDKGFSTLIVPVQEHFLRSTRHQLSIPDEKPGLAAHLLTTETTDRRHVQAVLRRYVRPELNAEDPTSPSVRRERSALPGLPAPLCLRC